MTKSTPPGAPSGSKGCRSWPPWGTLCADRGAPPAELTQPGVPTSLIGQFLYPKFGPGQMWETCAQRVTRLGGEIRLGWTVDRVMLDGQRVVGVRATDTRSSQSQVLRADFVLSSMPVRDLVGAMADDVPAAVREVAAGLVYRDFITVGLLLNKLKARDPADGGPLKDNWIYIQEPDVRLGRLQLFNNWSPYLVADPTRVWLGLEYFCQEGDDLWRLPDAQMAARATDELVRIRLADAADVCDATVIRVPKAYPAYFGTYARFQELRRWLDRIENLYLIGRNGMHRYNNQDHSMLAAMTVVDNLAAGQTDKANIWAVNAEAEYHEQA